MTRSERKLLVAVARALATLVESPHVNLPDEEYIGLLNALEAFQPKARRVSIPKDIRDQSWRRDVAILGGDPSL